MRHLLALLLLALLPACMSVDPTTGERVVDWVSVDTQAQLAADDLRTIAALVKDPASRAALEAVAQALEAVEPSGEESSRAALVKALRTVSTVLRTTSTDAEAKLYLAGIQIVLRRALGSLL